MTLTLAAEPVPLRLAEEGRVYRVGETRVSLDSVIDAYRSGRSAEVIATDFDTLKLADVLLVLAYYLNHRDAVDAYLAEREAAAELTRQRFIAEGISPADPAAGLRGKLLARRKAGA